MNSPIFASLEVKEPDSALSTPYATLHYSYITPLPLCQEKPIPLAAWHEE